MVSISDILKHQMRQYSYLYNMNSKAVDINNEILGGTPVFKGTRVPIQTLFDWLESETLEDFLENFPTVKRDQALEVLRLAERLVTDEKILNENSS